MKRNRKVQLTRRQYGFRAGRSIIDALHDVGWIKNGTARGMPVIAISLDK